MSRHLYMPDAKWSDIVEDYAWCKQVYLPNNGGTRTVAPDGFIFISLLYVPGLSSIRNKGRDTWFLYVKPTELAREKAGAGCVSGNLNCIEVIQQISDKDKFLVCGRDASHIGSPWLTYITHDELPTDEFIENVKEYQP